MKITFYERIYILEYVEDYFNNGKAQEFCDLIRENLIRGWEEYTGQKFNPTITLGKVRRGRILVSSYVAVKEQKTDVYMVIIRQIGQYIAKASNEFCEYSDFIVDEDKILAKDFENTRIYVDMC